MARICPITGVKVLYTECLECEEKLCKMGDLPGENSKEEPAPIQSFITKSGGRCAGCGKEHRLTLVKDSSIKIETYRFDTPLMVGTIDGKDYNPNEFLIDVVEEDDRYVAWISHDEHVVKLCTFAVSKNRMTKDEFLGMVLNESIKMLAFCIMHEEDMGVPQMNRPEDIDEEDEDDEDLPPLWP